MKKKIRISLIFGLVCAICLSFFNFNLLCDDLRQNVLRLHIIANSDSEADQELKLKIRDAILSETGSLFANSQSLEEANLQTEQHLKKFEEIANRVINENGFGYDATATIGERFFETRHYENFTLPAGNYRSLIINLGESKGKNWWCVIYPTVCLPAASGDLRDTVNNKSAHIAEHSERYIIRFKIVEIFEKIKLKLSNFK
ncbi:MAG: stage II sporulation protein R [Clostridia bacterium]|nr:stage II sporulation protein R [Clostridia bacterium]MBR6741216.1 stage II sporulation protein R [Clostridia bacterium]